MARYTLVGGGLRDIHVDKGAKSTGRQDAMEDSHSRKATRQ